MRIFLKNRRGGIGVILALSAAGLVFVMAAMSLSGGVISQTKALKDERSARLAAEVILVRLGQAVAATGVLCRQGVVRCWWNDKIQTREFGFKKVTSKDETMMIEADVCLPTGRSDDPADCANVEMSAELRFGMVRDLASEGILSGIRNSGDGDDMGIAVTAIIPYNEMKAGGMLSREEFRRAAVIRRPRAFLKVETTPGFCTAGCRPPVGNNPAPPCYSGPQFTGDDSQAGIVNVKVMNDGPGFIYDFAIKRTFTPNRAAFPTAQGETKTYTAKELGFQGLEPGGFFEFQDRLPCLTEVRVAQVEIPFGTGPTVTTSVTQSLNKTGDVEYEFLPNSIDPNNVLIISRSGTTIPAALVETEIGTPTDPGGGGGGDGDGCDGGDGGDGF